ncbi:uncharacterized protein LOC124434315 [Xenia sp. Carnegie-2017]|uniref:uncharacterized protein LOC124434315 n=1 Tax=Xenia sp. Carnegie-2017 TaxID=2897299 RepID=UPI001F0372E2|nr:uncharacterized protein LOC124434315 [Xenia sp. Carnegie-2017]
MKTLAQYPRYSNIEQGKSEWNPRNMMVDFSLAEISAIEECFPKTHVHVCDFHREKAWGEWLSKSSNGVSMYKDEVLRHLRNIAQSENQATLDENIQALKKSRPWKESVQLQNYFLDFWGLYLEKWVRFFRDEHLRIAIYTNNGIERQNNWLKHSYLESRRNNSVSDLVDVIINHFLPDSYKKYKEQNIRCTSSYRGYDDRVPKYLHDRPRGVVQHIISRIDSGIQISNIKKETPKLFIVQGAECAYQVRLGSDEELPSCQCLDFRTKKLLCKHICAVVQQPDIGWESLGRKFDKYPLFTLDKVITQRSSSSATKPSSNSEYTPEQHIIEKKDSDQVIHVSKSNNRNLSYRRKSNIRKQCIQSLKSLQDELYVVTDRNVLSKALVMLDEIIAYTRKNHPNEEGVSLKDKSLSPKKQVIKTQAQKQTKTRQLKQRAKKLVKELVQLLKLGAKQF